MPLPIAPLSLGFSSGPSTAFSGNQGDTSFGNLAPIIANAPDLRPPAIIIGSILGLALLVGAPKRTRRKRRKRKR